MSPRVPGNSTEGGVDFWIFGISDLLLLNLDWQKNSKTKVEKKFFFMFMSSYEEMCFGPKKVKKSLNRVKKIFFFK
jgi:hypothetical protein